MMAAMTDVDLEKCAEIEWRAIALIEKGDFRRLTVREKIAVGIAVGFTFETLRNDD
jgi:hypothetical protein